MYFANNIEFKRVTMNQRCNRSKSIFWITGVARVLQYRQSAGEKIIITTGDSASRGGFIKYDLEIRESDVVSHNETIPI